MRNGFKVWDTDTHIHPSAETFERYFDSSMRARIPELEKLKVAGPNDPTFVPRWEAGRNLYRFPGQLTYKRILGQAESVLTANPSKFMGTVYPSAGVVDDAIDVRIREMDEEGIDVQLLVPGVPTGVFLMNDPALEAGLIRAHNRFIDDICGRHPHRLKSLIVASGSTIEQSLAEIERWKHAPWAVGIWPFPAQDMPLDHPAMEPFWKACADYDLCVVHHSFAWTPPYFPGYRDMWDNVFLSRSAAHPWGAMRAIGSFIGSGIMDRYPTIRFGILECGCSWLPFWTRRLEDQAHYVGTTAPLKHSFEEYITGGRFFASIEMPEGQALIKMTIDFLGEGVLMWASDYPHAESQFPHSVDNFLKWDNLNDDLRRKMLWDNAVRFYGEP
jgi:predicted TIM-barrel fold metal-dependent hydrolase